MKKLALLAVSCLVGLLLAEAVVRLTGAAPEVGALERGRYRLSPNPRIGYEPIPHYEYRGDDLANFDFRGRSNALGFRDREHSVAKPPGTFRILVLGDSIAAGHRVERTEDVFPAQLEAILRERGIPAEVLNFAVSGYNTEQEVETLKDKGLAYRPDLVLVAYCLNDRQKEVVSELVGQLLAAGREDRAAAEPTGPSWLLASHLYRLVRFRGPGSAGRGQTEGDTDTAVPATAESTVEPAFTRLAELSHAHRFEVLVAVFPRFRKLSEYGPWEGEHRAVAALAGRHGFAHLDLLATYRGPCSTGDLDDIAFDRWHPTARGHRCAAEAMAGAVEAIARRYATGTAGR